MSNKRSEIKLGQRVNITEKHNQRNGIITEGHVSIILTRNQYHSRGIKVRLTNGKVGRILN